MLPTNATSEATPLNSEAARTAFRRPPRRRRVARAILIFFLAGIIFGNLVVYFHAYRMTHFSASGTRTGRPEKLNPLQRVVVLLGGVNIPKPQNKRTPSALGLPYTTVHIASPQNNATLECWLIEPPREVSTSSTITTTSVAGTKNPTTGTVLLFHGYAASKSSLLDEAKVFSDLGWRCILTDFYGSGSSSRRDTSIGYHEAHDVRAVLRYAAAHTTAPIVLYGKSMGAAAILRAISLDPNDATALIIESPFDRVISTAGNRFRTIGLPAFPFAQLITFWGGIQNNFPATNHNPVDYAKAVAIPTLHMAGSRDTRVTPEQTKSIFKNLGNPASSKLIFFDAAHTSFNRTHPKRWHSEVASFIAGVTAHQLKASH
jgi:uncharacterized protein